MSVAIGAHGLSSFLVEIAIYTGITIVLEYIWDQTESARKKMMDYFTNKIGPSFRRAMYRMKNVVRYGIQRLYYRRAEESGQFSR